MLAESLALRLRLTKMQKATLINLSKFIFNSTKTDDITYLKKVIYSHGKDFVKHKVLISLAQSGQVNFDVQTLFEKIDEINIPDFPINGKSLIELGITDCAPMREIIAGLKNKWIESGFSLSSDDLRKEALKKVK